MWLESHSKIYRRNIVVSQTDSISNTNIGHLGFMPNSVKMSKHLFFNSRIEVSILKNICFDISLIIQILKTVLYMTWLSKFLAAILELWKLLKFPQLSSAQPNSKLILTTKSTWFSKTCRINGNFLILALVLYIFYI